jgi:ParB/RepB/Spo0J family partition protein
MSTATKSPPADPARPQETFATVPLDKIRPSPTNPRKTFNEKSLADLAQSIRTHGVLQAPVVRPDPADAKAGFVELVCGERRLRAARLAGLTHLLVAVRRLTDVEVLELQLVENDEREDVLPSEQAAAYARLVQAGRTAEEIVERTGKPLSYVRSILALAKFPPEVLEMVDAGRLPRATAELIARVPGEQARAKLAAHVLAGFDFITERHPPPPVSKLPATVEPLSYRDTKDLIARSFQVQLKGASFPLEMLDLVPGASDCHTCPKRAGNDPCAVDEGTRSDMCLDPECFRAKSGAWAAKVREAHEREGRTVLDQKEAAKLFSSWDPTRVNRSAPYYDLAEQCQEDTKKKKRSYKQLVGSQLADQVVVAIDGRNNVHRLVPRAAADALLTKTHGLKPHVPYVPGRRDHADPDEERRRRAEAKLKRETDREYLRRAADAGEALFKKLPHDDPRINQVLRVLLDVVLDGGWGTVVEDMAGRRGESGRMIELRGTLKAWTLKAGGPVLMGTISEYLAGRLVLGWGGSAEGKTLTTALGLPTRAAVEKEVKTRLREERAAKKQETGKVPPAVAKEIHDRFCPNGKNGKAHKNGKPRPALAATRTTRRGKTARGKDKAGDEAGPAGPPAEKRHGGVVGFFGGPAPPEPPVSKPAGELPLRMVFCFPVGVVLALEKRGITTLGQFLDLAEKQDAALDHRGKIVAAIGNVPLPEAIIGWAADAVLDHLHPGRADVRAPAPAGAEA